MNTFKTSLVTASVFGMFVATASGQVRLFMAADGEESTVATTGNTQVTMFPGTSKKIMVWLEDTVQNQELNFYQVVVTWNAAPQPGAEGSVAYVDNQRFACTGIPFSPAPCHPLDDTACDDSPENCVAWALDSVLIDEDRLDNVLRDYGGINWLPAYDEIPPTQSPTSGFLFIDSIQDIGLSGVVVPGVQYLGEFVVRASADALGDFEMQIVPSGGQPGGGTSFGAGDPPPGEYVVDAIQNLTVSVLSATCPNGTVAECCDPDADGVRNDGCVRCRCDASPDCSFENVLFADVGGSFGDCEPDGFCNVHDRNHALHCFSGTSACESLFVDAGGAFGSCVPDGACNVHDANHALTCFSGTNACMCPSGPSPEVAPVTVGAARLRVVPEVRTIVAGGEIQVRVFVERSPLSPQPSALGRRVGPTLPGLQSYQLHLGVSGGRRGVLELVDVSIESRADFVFARRGDVFAAFNVGTGQMLAGIGAPDESMTSGAYLATFTYRATRDAVGVFVVAVRHSEPLTDQTYLISSFTDQIEIARTTPGVISVTRPVARLAR